MEGEILMKSKFIEEVRRGVSYLMTEDGTVAKYMTWDDLHKATDNQLRRGYTYKQGIPITQEDIDTYYPMMEKNLNLTKQKVAVGRVMFTNLSNPIAVEYCGSVYLIAPFVSGR